LIQAHQPWRERELETFYNNLSQGSAPTACGGRRFTLGYNYAGPAGLACGFDGPARLHESVQNVDKDKGHLFGYLLSALRACELVAQILQGRWHPQASGASLGVAVYAEKFANTPKLRCNAASFEGATGFGLSINWRSNIQSAPPH
jgi:hypothetical protein